MLNHFYYQLLNIRNIQQQILHSLLTMIWNNITNICKHDLVWSKTNFKNIIIFFIILNKFYLFELKYFYVIFNWILIL